MIHVGLYTHPTSAVYKRVTKARLARENRYDLDMGGDHASITALSPVPGQAADHRHTRWVIRPDDLQHLAVQLVQLADGNDVRLVEDLEAEESSAVVGEARADLSPDGLLARQLGREVGSVIEPVCARTVLLVVQACLQFIRSRASAWIFSPSWCVFRTVIMPRAVDQPTTSSTRSMKASSTLYGGLVPV